MGEKTRTKENIVSCARGSRFKKYGGVSFVEVYFDTYLLLKDTHCYLQFLG